MADWQAIKTAPKNNTKVLIYVPPSTVNGTHYPHIIMVSRHGGNGSYWWDAGHLKPTHWMPLPEPPGITTDLERAGAGGMK